MREPWAQTGRFPWVRNNSAQTSLLPVMIGRKLCADISALSGNKRMNDRIDEGSLLLYYLRLGTCAQRVPFLPAIRSLEKMMCRVVPIPHRVDQECARSEDPWAHSRVSHRCGMLRETSAQTARRCFTVHNLGVCKTVNISPEIDTGGERRC